jgi:TPR repeat protein
LFIVVIIINFSHRLVVMNFSSVKYYTLLSFFLAHTAVGLISPALAMDNPPETPTKSLRVNRSPKNELDAADTLPESMRELKKKKDLARFLHQQYEKKKTKNNFQNLCDQGRQGNVYALDYVKQLSQENPSIFNLLSSTRDYKNIKSWEAFLSEKFLLNLQNTSDRTYFFGLSPDCLYDICCLPACQASMSFKTFKKNYGQFSGKMGELAIQLSHRFPKEPLWAFLAVEQGINKGYLNLTNYCFANEKWPEFRYFFSQLQDKTLIQNSELHNSYAYMCSMGAEGPKDPEEARNYYKMAADQGDPEAQNNYACRCQNGKGRPEDLEEARKYFKMAADQGLQEAQKTYASMCRKGEGGSKDFNEARTYFKMAIAQGSMEAQLGYALMCHDGEGEPEDLKAAREYFKMAADQGLKEAQYNYAVVCYKGKGGPEDLEEALNYFKMSAAQGAPYAITVCHLLEKRSTSQTQTHTCKRDQEDFETQTSEQVEIVLPDLDQTGDSSDDEESFQVTTPEDQPAKGFLSDKGKEEAAPEQKVVKSDKGKEEQTTENLTLSDELNLCAQKNARDIKDFRMQKRARQKKDVGSRSLIINKKDYVIQPLQIHLCDVQRKHPVSFETYGFVKAVFSQGKINKYNLTAARKAFVDLGCWVEDASGENATLVFYKLDNKQGTMKLKFDNPHGHGENVLYNALKRFIKPFLISIGKTPETCEVK